MIAALLLVAASAAAVTAYRSGEGRKETFTAEELGIPVIRSGTDRDGDGIEDYEDMVEGVRAYFATEPHYQSAYYAGGYPDDGNGVCTDVIWQAFRAAGYDLKEMVDEDIETHRERYPHIRKKDSNIDFRRVRTLRCFFDAHAQTLTTDITRVEEWQAGDIVIFGDNDHIGICSDLRSRSGLPLLLHHGNPVDEAVERNDIPKKTVAAHYRWPG